MGLGCRFPLSLCFARVYFTGSGWSGLKQKKYIVDPKSGYIEKTLQNNPDHPDPAPTFCCSFEELTSILGGAVRWNLTASKPVSRKLTTAQWGKLGAQWGKLGQFRANSGPIPERA